MAGPNDPIVAVFKADIDQYTAEMAAMAEANKATAKTTDQVTTATDQLSKKTKTSASAIKTLGNGLGGITGLLALSGRLIGVNTDKLQELVFASQQFVSISKKVVDAQKLSNAASAASIPILGAIIGVVAAVGAVLIRYQDQIFGVTEAQLEKTKADDGAIITDEKLRDSYNESLKTIRDLGIEYRLITGEINEYQASVERLRNKNKDDIDQIAKDTKTKTEEITGFWGQVRLAVAKGLGVEQLEAKKILDELGAAIEDRNKLILKKGEELTGAEKVALEERFKQIDKDTERLLKANQDRIDKQRSAQEASLNKEFEAFVNYWDKVDKEDRVRSRKLLQQQLDEQAEAAEKKTKAAQDFQKSQDELEGENRANLLKNNDKENTKLAKQAEDARIEEIEAEQRMLDIISDAQQQAFDKRQELLQKEIDNQDKNIERQRDLADKGLANTLAFEEKRAADLERQQQKEAEKQKKLKLLETFLNALASYSKTDPDTALQKALLEVALATAATAVFAEEGGVIGEIGERSNLSRKHRGGGDILVHAQTGEGILPRDAMDAIGRRNFELLKNAGRHPVRDDIFALPNRVAMNGGSQVSNDEVVKEIKTLQRIIKNKRETSYNLDEFGNYTKKQIENGFATITKGRLKKPRLP